MSFQDLPVELLPEILQFVVKPQHLVSACLVNQTFRNFATSRLYDRISIYSWHKDGKTKVIKLFDTLSRCAYLALLVVQLELRDFPKTVNSLDSDLLDQVLRGLRNCSNLRSCTWTRDGSLNSEILGALRICPDLEDLEINGHDGGNYDPRLLSGFKNLKRLSIIMPSVVVVSQLHPWLSSASRSLQSLTLICKASGVVTDSLLESLAPHLVHLEYLHLTGCPKVTHAGVWALVSTNGDGLLGLGLEGVSAKFNMIEFADKCSAHVSLRRLRTVTLTVPQPLRKDWIQGVVDLLSNSPLELFQIYAAVGFFASSMTDDLWQKLVATHGERLLRFSIHRMLISMEAIRYICTKCTRLEQLFVVIEPGSLDELPKCLSLARTLRSVHVNYPLDAYNTATRIMRPDEVLKIVNQCSSTLTQFGCNSRVWQVGRMITNEDGVLRAHAHLGKYENPDIPEQFLVVRT